jgi:type I restriction enzyme S subunit
MGSEWVATTIGELCDSGLIELQTGPFGTQLHASDYVDDGIHVVPTEAIRDRQIDHSVLPAISRAKAKELERHRLRRGDILFARRGVQATGQIGCIREAEEGFICGTGAIRLRVLKEGALLLTDYLSHVLANPAAVAWFKFHAIGATMPNLNEGIIRSFPFALPPMSYQRTVAGMLSALDDKIDLNRRMSQTLESMTRTIFRGWFVDFVPVLTSSHATNLGLLTDAPMGVPTELVNSPIGPIPCGWRVEMLQSHVTVERGLSYGGAGLGIGDMPMYNLNSVREGGGYKHEGLKFYAGEYRPQHLARPGDLLVANTEQGHERLLIGYAAIAPNRFETALFSHHLYRLQVINGSPLTPGFLCWLLNSDVMHETVSGYANGTTVNMLPAAGLQRPLLCVPPAELIRAFTLLADQITSRCEVLFDSSEQLAAMRDQLSAELAAERPVGRVPNWAIS